MDSSYSAPRVAGNADLSTLDRSAFERAGAAFVPVVKPAQWPGPESGACEVALMYDDSNLLLCYEIGSGSFTKPDEVAVAAAAAAAAEPGNTEFDWARGVGMPAPFWSILNDDRVEIFLWVKKPAAAAGGGDDRAAADEENDPVAAHERGESYFAIECNRAGAAIQMHVGFRKEFDFSWPGAATALRASCTATAGGGGGGGGGADTPCRMVLALAWDSVGVDVSAAGVLPEMRVALCRGMKGGGESGTDEGGEVTVWSSWIDPGDDEVNFHRSQCFGELRLLP